MQERVVIVEEGGTAEIFNENEVKFCRKICGRKNRIQIYFPSPALIHMSCKKSCTRNTTDAPTESIEKTI